MSADKSTAGDAPSEDIDLAAIDDYLRSGRVEDALDLLPVGDTSIIPDVLMRRGICHFRLGQFDDGCGDFRSVVHARPWAFRAWYYIGLCNERLGARALAYEAFSTSALLAPNFELAHNKLAGFAAEANNEPETPMTGRPPLPSPPPAGATDDKMQLVASHGARSRQRKRFAKDSFQFGLPVGLIVWFALGPIYGAVAGLALGPTCAAILDRHRPH